MNSKSEAGMPDGLSDVAAGIFTDVMKTFAAINVSNAPEKSATASGLFFLASQACNVNGNNRVILLLPEKAARLIAARILGTENPASVAADMVRDAIKELLNIFAGNLLPIISGSSPDAVLGLPDLEVFNLEKGIAEYENPANTMLLGVESWPVLIKIELKQSEQ